MKLKIRIAVVLPILVILFFMTLMTAYFHCVGNFYAVVFQRLNTADEATTPIDELAPIPEQQVFMEDMLRSLHERKRKKRRNPTPFKLDNDSNRALEEELNDGEVDALLNNMLFPSKVLPDTLEANSLLRSRFISECLNPEKNRHFVDKRRRFPELVQLSKEMKTSHLFGSSFRKPRITVQELQKIQLTNNFTTLQEFQFGISNEELYKANDLVINTLLKRMATMSIKSVVESTRGTQLKLIVTYEDGSEAMLKPMRFDRSRETDPNHFYFTDFERHNSEIAAFHLDRILGFRRCPPIVGRKIQIRSELFEKADQQLKRTFFISPANNVCFHGHCRYYCDTSHAICGHPDTVEVSLAAMLPATSLMERKRWRNPWRRSYKKREVALWQKDDAYCQKVKQQPLHNNSKRLADIMDMVILDFLSGNMDRHHYETFKSFGNDSFILHLDQGRGFGKANHDEMTILAPLKQCCFLYAKTFHRLVELQHDDMKLSTLMSCSLYRDPLNPVLLDAHLEALDRRLEIVLNTIINCIQKHAMNNVFF